MLGGSISSLPEDPNQLKDLLLSSYTQIMRLEQENTEQASQIEELKKEHGILLDELSLLRMKLFGRRSEKLSEQELLQSLLFDEAELNLKELAPEPSIEVPAHTRRKPRREKLPEELPRIEVVHDIPEEQKTCGCNTKLKCIGKEVSEKLDIIPQQLRVIRHIRLKYGCPACEGSKDNEHPAIRIAPVPPQIIPKGIASAGLLSYIITGKYCDGLPLYRQEKQFDRIGIPVPRPSMCEWVMKGASQCTPLIEMMHEDVRAGPMIQMDETPLQVLGERGRKNTTKSYMWVMRGGDPEHPILLYKYHQSRGAKVPELYLNGYQGYVQTDGYKAYDEVCKADGIIHVGSMAHARRKFKDAAKASKKAGGAAEGLSRIAKIYRIERRLRDQLKGAKISAEEFVSQRRESVQPILDGFHTWLEVKEKQVLPSSLLGKAVTYTLGQWKKLIRYLDQAYLTPDTNLVENAIRPFCLGRKNWLFSGSPRGAHASAALFSLIESAKANGIEPYRYLRHIFEQIPRAKTREELETLLPHRIKPPDLPVL